MLDHRGPRLLAVCAPELPATLAERDDDALMALAAADHRAAFEVLVGRYLHRVSSYCAKFLGDVPTGEELALDVLVEAWAQRHRYRARGRFPVFLFALARNRCLNRARDERRRRRWHDASTTEPGCDTAGETADQLDRLLERERERRVREALAALAPKLREALLFRFDQGLEYADIARIVGRPEVTVRSRVFHGLRRLRAALGEEDPT